MASTDQAKTGGASGERAKSDGLLFHMHSRLPPASRFASPLPSQKPLVRRRRGSAPARKQACSQCNAAGDLLSAWALAEVALEKDERPREKKRPQESHTTFSNRPELGGQRCCFCNSNSDTGRIQHGNVTVHYRPLSTDSRDSFGCRAPFTCGEERLLREKSLLAWLPG